MNLESKSSDLERVIRRKSTGSLIYAILGLLGFAGIILGPLAYIRAGQALELIEDYGVGQRHRSDATLARKIAAVASVFWGVVFLGLLILALQTFLL